MSFVNELWVFVRERKRFWLLPICLMAGLAAGVLMLTQGSAVVALILGEPSNMGDYSGF